MATDAWYYFRNDGTGSGDSGRYTTEKDNNAWDTEFTDTSQFYAEIDDCLAATTPPTADSRIYGSHLSVGANQVTLSQASPPAGPVTAYSVDDNAIQEFLAGAICGGTGGSSNFQTATVGLTVALFGITGRSEDDVRTDGNGQQMAFYDAPFILSNANGDINAMQRGTLIGFYNIEMDATSGITAQLCQVTNGGTVEFIGGSVTKSSGTFNDFCKVNDVGGGTIRAIGTNLEAFDSVGTFLLGGSTTSKAEPGFVDVRIDKCKLSANISRVENQFNAPNQVFFMTNSSAVAAEAEYQFYQRLWSGDVVDQDSSGIIRAESEVWTNGEQVSFKCTTTSICGPGAPLVFTMPVGFMALSGSSKTVRMYVIIDDADTLNDTEVYFKVTFPLDATKNEFITVTTLGTRFAGSLLTEDTDSTWENNGVEITSGFNKYLIDAVTSGGADSYPLIEIIIEKASVTLNIDVILDLVA